MLERLYLKNFVAIPSGIGIFPGEIFSLKTCQRYLILSLQEISLPSGEYGSMEERSGVEAYHYLLEVLCGVQSRMLAENEIVGQFKEAYRNYLQRPERQRPLIRVLEKLLQDAKEIRTNHLSKVGQKTYGAITQKLVCKRTKVQKVLIIGAGQLAVDIANRFKKRADQVFISSRNEQKVKNFCQRHLTCSLPWREFERYREFAVIINTIGVEGVILFDQNFFDRWYPRHTRPTFVDLGHPSTIVTPLGVAQGVIRLDYIFEQSAIREKEKRKKIDQALAAIRVVSLKRAHLLRGQTERPLSRELEFA